MKIEPALDALLTAEQYEALALLATGASSKEIARHLNKSDDSIRVYLHKIYKKLGCHNKTAAVMAYLRIKAAKTPPSPDPVDAIVVGAKAVDRRKPNLHYLPLAPGMGRRPQFTAGHFGEQANRVGLLMALGAMSGWVGKGLWPDNAGVRHHSMVAERATSLRSADLLSPRVLYEWLLDGDFAKALSIYRKQPARFMLSPATTILLLFLGGDAREAQRMLARCAAHRDYAALVNGEIGTVVRAVAEIVGQNRQAAWKDLRRVAESPLGSITDPDPAEVEAWCAVRDTARVILFHLYRRAGLSELAAQIAEILFIGICQRYVREAGAQQDLHPIAEKNGQPASHAA